MEGPTLADRIAKGPIPLDEALPIAKQIAEALEAAHEAGVIHRDLKPANIKVREDGTVKVLDFGLAKALDPNPDADPSQSPTLTAAATQMGVIMGTAAYMSPEQARGKPVDKRADIWSFGVVLYEMLSGRRAFEGEDVSLTLSAVLQREPEWNLLPLGVPSGLSIYLRRCLEKDPRQRIQAIGDVRLAMEGVFETGDHEAAESVVTVAPALWRRVLPAIATAVVVGAMALPAGWVLKPADPRPVIRSVHALPDGRFFPPIGLLLIAPDGEHFVYNGNDGLYLRALDTLEDRPIPGTEGIVVNPFLSPDGQSVGFFRPGRGGGTYGGGTTELVRLAVTGGASVKLADTDLPSGASWGTDGMILYGQPDGIWQVSENGGEPEHLIATDPGVEQVYGPQRLPGGDWVMFTLAPTAGVWDEADIVVESLTSGDRKVLRQGGMDARYVPTGHLVYAYQNVLYAVPFDVSSLVVVGGPVPVVQGVRVLANVTIGSGAAVYAFTTGGTLVYVPGSMTAIGGNTLAWVDLSGGRDIIDLPPGQYAHPRFSPDGQWLALERRDGMRTDVWLYDVSGATALRRLTEGGTNRYPVWSHDGEHVVFQSDRDGDAGIFWQQADGTGSAERLTTPESDTVHVPEAWSPTDDRLAFSAMTGNRVELWLWTLQDRASERFGDIQSEAPFNTVFSPDGQWVAYTQRTGGAATYVQSVSAPETRYQIGRDEEAVHHPLWTPDGSRLFYFPGTSSAVTVDVTTEPTFSYGRPVPLPGGGLPLNVNTTVPLNHDIAPDGSRFVTVLADLQGEASTTRYEIVLVQNWFEELMRLVPVP